MKRMTFSRKSLQLATLLAVLGIATSKSQSVNAQEIQKPTLTIGSVAPDIDVQHWVSDGNGKFKPIKKFEADSVYVVEFWATWCGPCIASMPHLSELQKSYADKKVQLISVSDEDLETVKQFLERPVQSSEDAEAVAADKPAQTYGQLTSNYCLTTDPDQSVSTDYMLAAGLNGIPSAFIVGKDGKIEWIGHPMSMDEPLQKVVAGSWDREAFATEYKKQQEIEMQMNQLMALAQRGDFAEALQLLEKIEKETTDPSQLQQMQMYRIQLLMQSEPEKALAEIDKMIAAAADAEPLQQFSMKMMKVQALMQIDDEPKLVAAFQDALTSVKEQPTIVLQVCLGLVQMAKAEQVKSSKMLNIGAIEMEAASAKLEDSYKIMAIDASARLYAASGNMPKAIELEKEAIKLTKDEQAKASLEEYLKSLEAGNASAKKE